jgi:hypothetical protein
MANRGRPRKVDLNNVEDVQFDETIETNEVVVDEQPIPKADNIGEGTYGDYNPFAESVVERDYSTPKRHKELLRKLMNLHLFHLRMKILYLKGNYKTMNFHNKTIHLTILIPQ